MNDNEKELKTDRRGFLGSVAAGAAALGASALATPISLAAGTENVPQDTAGLDAWFAEIKGKRKIVFDATQPHGILPFAWPRVFLMSNEMTGSMAKDCSVVVVMRHDAIPYAFEERVWVKYKFGETFKANDPATNAPSMRNPFAKPKPDEYQAPGLGTVLIGINELQASGVKFCVCNTAINVYSAVVGQAMSMDPAEVKKDWLSAVLPGIKVVPSGVWALGRAQERGCGYIFAG